MHRDVMLREDSSKFLRLSSHIWDNDVVTPAVLFLTG